MLSSWMVSRYSKHKSSIWSQTEANTVRYVPSPTKTRILFDKGEARAYNLPEWTRGVILDPITEIAANDTRKWEFLDYNCFLDQMAVNNPLIHDAYLAHANRVLFKAYIERKGRRAELLGPIGRINARMQAKWDQTERRFRISGAQPF